MVLVEHTWKKIQKIWGSYIKRDLILELYIQHQLIFLYDQNLPQHSSSSSTAMKGFRNSAIEVVVFGTLAVVLTMCVCGSQGYGFRYRADPITGESQLWTLLPGMASPSVYQNDILVKSGVFAEPPPKENPGLYQYRAPNGEFKWKCKPNASYSEFFKKCQWNPSRYFG